MKVHVLDGGKSEVLKSGSEFLIKGFEKKMEISKLKNTIIVAEFFEYQV